MKEAVLLHNPKAGDEDHSKEKLLKLLKDYGYKCRYTSTKKDDWDEIDTSADLIIIAGGDGTVRKVVTELLKRDKLLNIPPVGLIPLGTANNISRSLKIPGEPEEIVRSWENNNVTRFDLGVVEGITETEFFLEAFGFGIFPSFINKADKENIDDQKTADGRLKATLKSFHKFISEFRPRKCSLVADGEEINGEFLMAEVMNISSIGPNLQLAAAAKISDGMLDLLIISEKEKEELENYVLNKLNGEEMPFPFPLKKTKSISISCEGSNAHADDLVIDLTPLTEIKITVKPGLLTFLK